jgi:hypothetical protein
MNRRNLLLGTGATLAAGSLSADEPVTLGLQRAAREAWLFVLPLQRGGDHS